MLSQEGVLTNYPLKCDVLMFTDAQTPFLGTPLVPLKTSSSESPESRPCLCLMYRDEDLRGELIFLQSSSPEECLYDINKYTYIYIYMCTYAYVYYVYTYINESIYE